MSAPSPLTGRGRGVARRWGFRQKPIRRPGAEALEEESGPEHVYVMPNTWRPMPPTDSPDPARARWVRLVLDDPAAARRERIEQRLQYWRARLSQHEERLGAIRAKLDAALFPPRDVRQAPVPAAAVWALRVEYGAAWADLQHARAQAAALERELADA